ncbi:MAG TPA: GNAT family N-acetyltransferase [Acetobacteraceae bacterium]|nr:GNAT family N-acetyltransferase [Acetobacteraceae bacterium]
MSKPVSGPKRLEAPQPLGSQHRLEAFACGVEPLDEWLKRRALHNENEGGSRTFVLCEAQLVVGYYSLAAGSVLPGVTTGRVRRNMPNPIPVVLLGRLAVDRRWQGKGLGADLLRDALLRVLSAGETIGVRAVLVHAISAEAKRFYERYGFHTSPIEPMTLMITLAEVGRMFANKNGGGTPRACILTDQSVS